MMYEAALKKGLPVPYVVFEGEQHGFRKAENIKRSLDGELYFYSKVFGFELAEKVERVDIANLQFDVRLLQPGSDSLIHKQLNSRAGRSAQPAPLC